MSSDICNNLIIKVVAYTDDPTAGLEEIRAGILHVIASIGEDACVTAPMLAGPISCGRNDRYQFFLAYNGSGTLFLASEYEALCRKIAENVLATCNELEHFTASSWLVRLEDIFGSQQSTELL